MSSERACNRVVSVYTLSLLPTWRLLQANGNVLFGSDINQIIRQLYFARDPTGKASGGSKGGCYSGLAIEVLVHLTSVMSLWTCHSSFLVTENSHIWQLHQYCENCLQMENKSQENSSSFRHSKRCKIMPKMHQNTFGGRAPPGPAGGALALLQTP